jgi:hypothetical protein
MVLTKNISRRITDLEETVGSPNVTKELREDLANYFLQGHLILER